jgi:hypothetical protein
LLGSDRLLWTRDGKGGPDDPHTSMSTLLKWLTTEGNYSKYRGGPTSHGKGKLHWASIISADIKTTGIRKYRSSKAIKNKIINLEETFKNAHDWAGQTGAGVKEDDPQSFDEYVLKKCPHYFDLLPVMQDRSNARPKLTSDNLEDIIESDGELNIGDNSGLDSDDSSGTDSHDNDDMDGTNGNDIPGVPINGNDGPVVASVPPTNKKQAASKKPLSRKADPVSAVVGMQKEAMAEAQRHNMQMEELKKREIENTHIELQNQRKFARYKEEELELTRRVALVKAYNEIKGMISNKLIREKFPELKDFIDDDEEATGG